MLITCDGAGSTHALVEHPSAVNTRPGAQVHYLVGFDFDARVRTRRAAALGDQTADDRELAGESSMKRSAATSGYHGLSLPETGSAAAERGPTWPLA
jgi:hypothetical protein